MHVVVLYVLDTVRGGRRGGEMNDFFACFAEVRAIPVLLILGICR